MAVQITQKGKVTTPTKTTAASKALDELKDLADQYGQISQQITQLQNDPQVQALLEAQKQLEDTKTQIKEKADVAFKEDEGQDVVGKQFTVNVSAKGNESKVKEEGGKEAIFSFLGEETFVQLCTFPITQLRAYLNPKQLEEVLETKRTKARTVKLK